ncbi:MAG: prepilin peptidase [Defluviitaleaceae bacterium]|nr:prepilin peptidase [Defluviitaleaceae bacterium]
MFFAGIILVSLIGLCAGSFANNVIYRVPRKISVFKPRPFCPDCGHGLRFFELIPMFSWLFLRGKCRVCKKRISVRYPLVEILCVVLFLLMAGYSYSAVPLWIFSFVLLTVSFIDADTQEIPDGLLIFGAVAGVLWVLVGFVLPLPRVPVWWDSLLGVVAGAVPLFVLDRITLLLLKKDGFGYGDVKLMAMVGLFLGWQLVLIAFLFAFIGGAIFAAYLLATGKAKRGTYMAFGPFLCAGSLLAFWFGRFLFDWYIGVSI